NYESKKYCPFFERGSTQCDDPNSKYRKYSAYCCGDPANRVESPYCEGQAKPNLSCTYWANAVSLVGRNLGNGMVESALTTENPPVPDLYNGTLDPSKCPPDQDNNGEPDQTNATCCNQPCSCGTCTDPYGSTRFKDLVDYLRFINVFDRTV